MSFVICSRCLFICFVNLSLVANLCLHSAHSCVAPCPWTIAIWLYSVEFPPIMMKEDQMSIPIMALLPPPELHTGLLGPVNQNIKMLKQMVPGVEEFMKINDIKGSGCGGDLNGPTIKKLLQNYNNQLTNLEILCRSVS